MAAVSEKSMIIKKKPPFSFIIDYLAHKEPVVKPMFGCHAIYIGRKIVLMLRKSPAHPTMNGIWIATGKEHHQRLKKLLPSMKSIDVLGKGETNWQMIPERAKDFESSALMLCELILKGDPSVGKIPKVRASRKRKKTPSH